MRNLKKVLSLVLVFALVLSLTAVAGASSFADVAGNYVYADAVDLLASLKILGGYEDGTFKPDNDITRAEFSKVVYAVYEGTDDINATMFAGNSAFKDVANTDWFSGHVNWAYNNAIVGGYGDGTVLPKNNVKVKEAIKMVVASVTDKALSYPNGYIQEAKARGILDGVQISSVDANATRGQVAQMAYNLLYTPSKLCMEVVKENGKIQYNEDGSEKYQAVKPIEFVFGLLSIGDPTYLDTNKYGDYINTVDQNDEDATVVVSFLGSYEKQFMATQTLEEGQIALMIDNKEVVVDYDGEVDNLYGQNVTLYYKESTSNNDHGFDTNDTVMSIIPTGATLVTTKDKLVGSGSTYKVGDTKISLPTAVDVDNVKTYFFRAAAIQRADGTYATDSTLIEGASENATLKYSAHFSSTAVASDDVVTLIDVDNNGVYDRIIVEHVTAAQVTSLTSQTVRLDFIGTNVNSKTSYSIADVTGLDGVKEDDYVNVSYVKNAEGDVKLTVKKAETVTGTLASSTDKTAVLDGKTYTGYANNSLDKTYTDSYLFGQDSAKKLVGDEVTFYLSTSGYVVAVEGVEDADYQLNLGVVTAATDNMDTRTGKLSASLTVLLPDGTEKALKIATADTAKDNTDISETLFAGAAKNWLLNAADNATTNYDHDTVKAVTEYYFNYDREVEDDYSIVGNYIHYELDEDTGYVKFIANVAEIGSYVATYKLGATAPTQVTASKVFPSNSDNEVTVEAISYVEGDQGLCFDKSLGYFYTLKNGKGSSVKDIIDVADDFVGMYYGKDENDVVTKEYYTASTIPNFELKGDYTIITNEDGDAVAMAVGTSATATADQSVIGTIVDATVVTGEAAKLSSGSTAYRTKITMNIAGEKVDFFTKDMAYDNLIDLTETDKDAGAISKDQLVTLSLDSNGKVAVTKDEQTGRFVADVDYFANGDLNWAIVTNVKTSTNRLTVRQVTEIKNSHTKGYTENEDGDVIKTEDATGAISLSGLQAQVSLCDESTVLLYKYDINATDTVAKVTTDNATDYPRTMKTLTAGSIDDIVTTDVEDLDNMTAYVVAFTTFVDEDSSDYPVNKGDREADDEDNAGCIDTMIVFTVPVDVYAPMA